MTYQLKISKWQFALGISVLNIISGYVVPYLGSKYFSGLEELIVDSLVTLFLNVIVIVLSIEENNAPNEKPSVNQ